MAERGRCGRSTGRELARGASALVGGLAFIVKTPRLWGWALVPAAIALALGAALAGLGFLGVHALTKSAPGTGTEWTSALASVTELLLDAIVLFVAFLLALALAQPIARAALDRLARSLEEHAGLRGAGAMPSSSLVRSLGTAATALGVSVSAIGALDLITVVLPESIVVTQPIALVVSGLALAWDLLDHPLSRRGMTFGARWRWVRANLAAVVGFAVAAQLLLLVPGIDLLFLPIGVVGATRLLAGSRDSTPDDHAH